MGKFITGPDYPLYSEVDLPQLDESGLLQNVRLQDYVEFAIRNLTDAYHENVKDEPFISTTLVQDHVMKLAYMNNLMWAQRGGPPPTDVIFTTDGDGFRAVIVD